MGNAEFTEVIFHVERVVMSLSATEAYARGIVVDLIAGENNGNLHKPAIPFRA